MTEGAPCIVRRKKWWHRTKNNPVCFLPDDSEGALDFHGKFHLSMPERDSSFTRQPSFPHNTCRAGQVFIIAISWKCLPGQTICFCLCQGLHRRFAARGFMKMSTSSVFLTRILKVLELWGACTLDTITMYMSQKCLFVWFNDVALYMCKSLGDFKWVYITAN